MFRSTCRGGALLALCSIVAGCSHLGSVGVGPVLVRPSGVERSFGDELRLRQGGGSSDGEALTVVEAQARIAVAERASAVAVGLGPAYLSWFGPLSLTVRGAPMLGVQYFDRTVFPSAGLHGGLALGMTMGASERRSVSWRIWADVPVDGRYERYVRERTLLTLELTGAADAQVRGATLSAALLLGVAWSDEQLTREFLPFHPSRRPLRFGPVQLEPPPLQHHPW
jgi:hypothetical protein